MPCRLCARWRARLWKTIDDWERAHSNESDLWSEESVRNRELIERAYAAQETDPAEAFRLYLEAAEAGSDWALDAVAYHYQMGKGVAADFDKAQDYYRRAISAGSWMATLYYARLLGDHGHHDECESVLEDGVESDFVPACFWLAWSRYRQDKSRRVCREIRPMLDYAAGQGHPGAEILLARLMTSGKFGLREIPAGIGSILRMAFRAARKDEEDADDRDPAVYARGRD